MFSVFANIIISIIIVKFIINFWGNYRSEVLKILSILNKSEKSTEHMDIWPNINNITIH